MYVCFLIPEVRKNPEKLKKRMFKDFKKGLSFTTSDFKNDYFAYFSYGQSYDYELDGIIGLPYLRSFKRVTFDFKNNYLYLDDSKLEGSKVKLIYDICGGVHCSIPFKYKDKQEIGIIDTGNYTFSPRSNFGKDNYMYKMDADLSYQKMNIKSKKRAPIVHTYNNIEICDIKINNIKGVYSNIWFSTYSKAAVEYLTKVNGLGCELFKDCIIQFDFETNEFTIQK